MRRAMMPVAMVGALMLAGAVLSSSATAGGYTSRAQYQTTFSFNCNTPAFCGPNLGGFWGWAQFNFDSTADAELIGCDHLQGGGAAAGAQHFSADVPGWVIAPASATGGQLAPGTPEFWITGETDTITGRTGGPPVTLTDPNPPYPS